MNGVGFFGKLPGAGDFVRRRLPMDFVTQWDRHCQRAIDATRRELGDAWSAAWRCAPTWRFVLPAQVCGASAWCGLVGPGFDRVGREFPLVIASPVGHDIAQVLANDAWFDALDRTFESAIDEALSVDTFDSRVSTLPSPHARFAQRDNGATNAASAPQRDDDILGDLIGDVIGESFDDTLMDAWRQIGSWPGAWCLWWTSNASRVITTRGLPSSFAAMLASEEPLPNESAGSGVESDVLPGASCGASFGAPCGVPPDDASPHVPSLPGAGDANEVQP